MNQAENVENIPSEAPRAKEWRRKSPYEYDPRAKSPMLAGVLSLMPGLGQIYVGYYQRGFVHVLVVASIISMMVNEVMPALLPLFGFFLAFFWLYNIIDAGRRAGLYNLALSGTDPMALPNDFQMPATRGSVAGGVALIGIGLILLLHTRFDISLDWLRYWWPLAPVLFGAWLVFKGVANGTKRAEGADRG